MRKHRAQHAVTEDERAAIRKEVRTFLRRVGCGHPLELPPSPEQVADHVRRTAERT